jgi:hypothetical protein
VDSTPTDSDGDRSLELAWQHRRTEEAKARADIAVAASRFAIDRSAVVIASAVRQIESTKRLLRGA